METFSFDNETIKLMGIIGFQTVSEIEQKGISVLKHAGKKVISVDLSGVLEGDSSLLAMLLSWQRQANFGGIDISFNKASDSLIRLACLCNLGSILSLSS